MIKIHIVFLNGVSFKTTFLDNKLKVSFVKILNKDVNMVYGTDEISQEEVGIKYTIKHLQILKKPKNIKNESLPNVITTASNTAMCGIDFLNVSDSYILSGQINSDNTLGINLCGGLVYNDDKINSMKKLRNYQKIIECS
uniref:NTR domain-containing protein n=1 Tax=Strongyloides stercoralis TaxID=6248 RepID=A0AAF5DB48_STRER